MTKNKHDDENGTPAVDEGARSFAIFLQHLDDGGLHADLSDEVKRVSKELTSFVDIYGAVAKGSLTLVLSFKADRNGTIAVDGEIKTKLPKAKRAGSVFWSTAAGNLSPENPRQQRLPLRDVTVHLPPREVLTETPDARTI